jgi:hypothetical protein
MPLFGEFINQCAHFGASSMSRPLISTTLNFLAGLAGNLIAGWIQQDVWGNLFTPIRIGGSMVGVVLMIVLRAILESTSKQTDFIQPIGGWLQGIQGRCDIGHSNRHSLRNHLTNWAMTLLE